LKKQIILSSGLALILLGCSGSDSSSTQQSSNVEIEESSCERVSYTALKSIRTDSTPNLDGKADDNIWKCAPSLEVSVNANLVYIPENAPSEPSYPGLQQTTVQIKSAYDTENIYFIVTWQDPTKSLERYPWQKQDDGSWKQLENRDSSGHENTYYEDKFAMQWNVNSPTFANNACYASCHAPQDNAHPSKKYNPSGEITDMWHWKSVRTEPNGQLDDKYVSYIDSGECKGENCRIGDTKESGGYKDNNFKKFAEACLADSDGSKQIPCFMDEKLPSQGSDTNFWIKDINKIEFVDTFNPKDQVAAMVTSAFVGSRGDVDTKAAYKNGVWTLEIKRALETLTPQHDVQFNDLSKKYPFGVAVFDNTQINHAAHGGVLHLSFQP